MTKLLYAEIDVICMAIIVIVYLCNRNNKALYDQKLFNLILFSAFFVCFFDGAMWLIDGADFNGAFLMNYTFALFYYLFIPFIPFTSLLYCFYIITGDEKTIKKKALPFSIPLLVSIILTVTNFLTHFVFSIDAANIYHRGSMFWMPTALSGGYLIACIIMLIIKYSKVTLKSEKKEYKFIALCMLLPCFATLLQIFMFGLSVMWVGTVFALLILFIKVQTKQIYTDVLTGLNNRRQLHKYLHSCSYNTSISKKLYCIFADVDNFKSINDKFGHREGDRALIKVSEILLQACHEKHDFVARISGDEFAVVCIRDAVEERFEMIEKINKAFEAYNKASGKKYILSLSMGYSIFGGEKTSTIDNLISVADKNMYIIKQQKKRQDSLSKDKVFNGKKINSKIL